MYVLLFVFNKVINLKSKHKCDIDLQLLKRAVNLFLFLTEIE